LSNKREETTIKDVSANLLLSVFGFSDLRRKEAKTKLKEP